MINSNKHLIVKLFKEQWKLRNWNLYNFDDYYDTNQFQYSWVLDNKIFTNSQIQNAVSSLEIGTHTLKLIVAQKSNTNIRDEQSMTLVWKNSLPTIDSLKFFEDATLGASKVTVEAKASGPCVPKRETQWRGCQ
jgi:hypothetical protein